MGPCEPGQVVTEAALSNPSQVYAGVAFRSLFLRALLSEKIRENQGRIPPLLIRLDYDGEYGIYNPYTQDTVIRDDGNVALHSPRSTLSASGLW